MDCIKTFREICRTVYEKHKDKDTGYKDGIKTTSYDVESGDFHIRFWHGDAEREEKVYYKNKLVGSFYDCWGRIKFDFDSSLLHQAAEAFKREYGKGD